MVGEGDFNGITDDDENLGGRLLTTAEAEDFNHIICNLEDQGFKESKYPWWNGRTDEECIFKRLDKVLYNDLIIQNILPVMEVERLIRSGSDHTPILLKFSTITKEIVKTFKFLNFWLKEVI